MRRGGRTAPALVAAAILTGGLTGCSPCQTLGGCDGSGRQVSETMQVIEHATGRPVGGVRVTFVRTGGAPLDRDSVSAVTDGNGMVTLRAGAAEPGPVALSVRVAPPAPWPAYQIDGVVVESYEGRGEGGILGRWVVDPYVEYVGEMFDSRDGAPLGGARVTFRRLGGPRMEPDSLVDMVEPSGRFFWEPRRVVGYGPILGEVRVDHPALPGGSVVIRGQSILPDHVDRPPSVRGTYLAP
jgi:hypothetical protein